MHISHRVQALRSFACPSFIAGIALLGLLLAAGAEPVGAQSQADEYRVKAAFLYHFVQLVDWPMGSLGDTGQPLNLCTIGDDPFQGELDRSVDGKSVGARLIHVKHLRDLKALLACQIVFIGKSEDKRTPAIFAELIAEPVLTVGESDNFAQQGGMIGFLLDENKIRFSINLDPAEKSGLKISSKLLLLAKEVIGNRGGK
jgi:hypothetical protein